MTERGSVKFLVGWLTKKKKKKTYFSEGRYAFLIIFSELYLQSPLLHTRRVYEIFTQTWNALNTEPNLT